VRTNIGPPTCLVKTPERRKIRRTQAPSGEIPIEADGAVFREVRASYFPNKAALPARTLLQVSRLANPAYLVEIDVIAVLPPKA
jgi:enamine deaminase RidA (YjgF/YER057c/UK114 family)